MGSESRMVRRCDYGFSHMYMHNDNAQFALCSSSISLLQTPLSESFIAYDSGLRFRKALDLEGLSMDLLPRFGRNTSLVPDIAVVSSMSSSSAKVAFHGSILLLSDMTSKPSDTSCLWCFSGDFEIHKILLT